MNYRIFDYETKEYFEKEVDLPSMARDERTYANGLIHRSFCYTFEDLKKETSMTKKQVLEKLKEKGYVRDVTSRNGKTYLMHEDPKRQPKKWSVIKMVYNAGGTKSYGVGELWLFKPYVVDILLDTEKPDEETKPITIDNETKSRLDVICQTHFDKWLGTKVTDENFIADTIEKVNECGLVAKNGFIYWYENPNFPSATVDNLKKIGWTRFYNQNKGNVTQ